MLTATFDFNLRSGSVKPTFTTFSVTDSVKCCCISSQFRFPVYLIYVEIYVFLSAFVNTDAVPPGSKSWRRHCCLVLGFSGD